MNRVILLGAVVSLFISMSLVGCFKKSPFGTELENGSRSLNQAQAVSIKSKIDSNNFTFAFISDTHQNYDSFEKTVGIINSRPEVDFVIHGGDMTNYSANWEYDLALDIFNKFTKPYLAVIGNHDAIAFGKDLYKKAFGPLNMHVQFADTHIFLWNNNRLEFWDEGIDFAWLKREVEALDESDQVIVVQHVDMYNELYFTEEQKQAFKDLFIKSGKVDLLLNGHRHVFLSDVRDEMVVHQTSRVEGRKWSRVTFEDGQVFVEFCEAGICEIETVHKLKGSAGD